MSELQPILWAGCGVMTAFTGLFYKSSLRVKEEGNRIFRTLMTLITFISAWFYVFMALVSPIQSTEGIIYIKWLVTTPMLLYLVSVLEEIPRSTTFILCTLDILTMASGFVAYMFRVPYIQWTMIGVGGFCWGCIVKTFLEYSFHFYKTKLSLILHNRNFTFTVLTLGIITVWSTYPIVTILRYSEVIDQSEEYIGYIVLDFFSKGVFGSILLGTKELEEGIESAFTLFSKSIIRVSPITLEPIQEETDIKVVVDQPKQRRSSIYLYTPPMSDSSTRPGGSSMNYSTSSTRTLVRAEG